MRHVIEILNKQYMILLPHLRNSLADQDKLKKNLLEFETFMLPSLIRLAFA